MEIDKEKLKSVAQKMLAPGKGILAADESNRTATKRLEAIGVESTAQNRRRFRSLFLETEGIENYLSGVILYEETINQRGESGKPFAEILGDKGIVVGIKVDKSTIEFPGFPRERFTEGLDGLRERLTLFRQKGALFTKWRAVIGIGENIPTEEVIHAHALSLSLYARIAQEEGFVPIIEPEVLLDGMHSIKRAEEVMKETLTRVFKTLEEYRVELDCVVLKSSMVLDGGGDGIEASPEEIAEATVRVLRLSVPDRVAGVVFLSGGQRADEATEHLNAIAKKEPLPWEIAFSFSRALQEPVLDVWRGEDDNVEEARKEFIHRLKLNTKADKGVL